MLTHIAKGRAIVLITVILAAGPAGANYLADITVSQESPCSLPNNWVIEVACDWQWDGGGPDVDAVVRVMPMTGGSPTPGAWSVDYSVPGPGSGACWPSFTVQTGEVVVDELVLTLETAPPDYEVLLELSIPVDIRFGPHAFYGISKSLESPNRVQFNQHVVVDYTWQSTYADGKRIVIRPMTGDAYTPNLAVTGSGIITGTSGQLNPYFTVTSGEVDVDGIQFEMYNDDWSELLHVFRIPADYHFSSTAIQNIELDPPWPSSRIHNNNITVDFDYLTDHPMDPMVIVTPYTDGAPTPGAEVIPPTPLAPGSGSGTTNFDILPAGGMVDVDELLFEMRDFFDPDILIDSFFLPVYYHFSENAIRIVDLDPLPPAILGHDTYVEATVTWDHVGDEDFGLLYGTPQTWYADTPDLNGNYSVWSFPGNNVDLIDFSVSAGGHLVDHLHFELFREPGSVLAMTYFLPVWYQFGGPAVLVPVDESEPSAAPELLGNFPNPFNPRTTITFDLPRGETVTLGVFDVAGREVRSLVADVHCGPGRHEVVWDGKDDAGGRVASGTYFCRIDAGGISETSKVVLVK